MPLYEYLCENGHRFEKIQKFSDPLIVACPTCGAPVQKLMSSPAFQFKGSGWYITDYAKKDSAGTEKGEAKADGAGDAKAGTKGDAKADTKTETKSESKSESKSETKAGAKP